MCYQHFHTCRFCNNQYECIDKNYICPTINNDADKNMCQMCKDAERNAFKQLLESGLPIPKDLSLDDWEGSK